MPNGQFEKPKIGGEGEIRIDDEGTKLGDLEGEGIKIEGGETAKTPEGSWEQRMEKVIGWQKKLDALQGDIERDFGRQGVPIPDKILEALNAEREELNGIAEGLNAEGARKKFEGYLERIKEIRS